MGGRRLRRGTTRVPACLPASHGGAHTARLRLVAGCQHYAATDDYGPAAQPGGVALLDGGVEGVEIGVQHRGLAPHSASRRSLIPTQFRIRTGLKASPPIAEESSGEKQNRPRSMSGGGSPY